MPEFNLSGVNVKFPFTPYDCQRDFMTKVITALQNNQNALLESPTGTGKTLCLLCSSLAWLETTKALEQYHQQMKMNEGEMSTQLMDALNSGAGNMNNIPGLCRTPRIIYASRTHTQLTQVISELKRTSYSGFRTAIIASRDQLCIHPTVMKESSNHAKQTACRVKVQTRTCHFYNNVEKKKDLSDFRNPEDPSSSILDIEDLKKLGNKHKCCPYYLTRLQAKEGAEIIFMPYNYLLDPVIRKRHGIDLDGSVLIFDEAHNLTQVAEDSASVEITDMELASCLAEVDAVFEYLENYGKDMLEADNFAATAADDEKINFELLTLENIARVKCAILKLEEELKKVSLSSHKDFKAGGEFMFDLLSKANIKFDTYLPLYDVMDAAIAYLTGGGYSGIHAKAYGLNKIAGFLKVVFESDTYNKDKSHETRKAHISQFYRVYIFDKDAPKPKKSFKSGWTDQVDSGKPLRVLAFWCFSPGFSMVDLQKQGVRCILLTSGTLKPLPSFSAELQIPFTVTLENPHVISPCQISVNVVKKGPENVVLNSNYQNRSDPKYHTSLGYAVMQIAKAVPNGMLVFFPSYGIMKMVIDNWQNGLLLQCIQRYKQIFVEPSDKEEFQLAMEQYYAMINDHTANGAIFCGVCRGKVSEGLDFIDKNGRAVVITGIPYAPAKDPKVVMKKSYLDEQLRNSTNKCTLTGAQWYSQQASRAVNQAIGRVIRHRFDYGAILLLDTRFSSAHAKEELPAWVRSEIVVHESFSSVIKTLNTFFSNVCAAVEKKKAASGVLTEPEKPDGKPKTSIQYTDSKLGISARQLYSDTPMECSSNGSTSTVSQPVRKKIKMDMVKLNDEEPVTKENTVSDSKTNERKLKAATLALHQCRQLLSTDELLSVKKSLLLHNKCKKVDALSTCIKILVSYPNTDHILATFREVLGDKLRAEYDELVTMIKSANNANLSQSIQGTQSQMQSQSGAKNDPRYKATLSLLSDCKKILSTEQNKSIKQAFLQYKNKGSVQQFYHSVKILGEMTFTRPLLLKFKDALRSSDLAAYQALCDDLLMQGSAGSSLTLPPAQIVQTPSPSVPLEENVIPKSPCSTRSSFSSQHGAKGSSQSKCFDGSPDLFSTETQSSDVIPASFDSDEEFWS